MEAITFNEFLDWLDFLGWQETRRDKTDFYFAQLAAEVKRGTVKRPNSVKIKDFYANFTDPAVAADRLKKSKATWGAIFKMDLN